MFALPFGHEGNTTLLFYKSKFLSAAFVVLLSLYGCGGNSDSGPFGVILVDDLEVVDDEVLRKCQEDDDELEVDRPPAWNNATHCKHVIPDPAKVFPINQVGKMTITMTEQAYADMKADLLDMTGLSSSSSGIDNATSDDATTDNSDNSDDETNESAQNPDLSISNPCEGLSAGGVCTQGDHGGVCMQTTGPMICQVDQYDDPPASFDPTADGWQFWERKPEYFQASVAYKGETFTNVGIRYKGNSSLQNSIGEKKPLRIKFDEWENKAPEIKNQRAFGFQSFSLAPNEADRSNLNQVLAAATYLEYGVPAPHAGFVEITLVTGEQTRLLGLYSITEIPDNPLLDRYFNNNDGNLYKPDGGGAHLVSFHEPSYEKENNKNARLDDIEDLIDALHADRTDRELWRTELAQRFDIEGYIDFLAVNRLISNKDTYGSFAHNYYLYTDEADNVVSYIPWDFDGAFNVAGQISLDLNSFGGEWPLLQAIARDVDYATQYEERVTAVALAEFESGKMLRRVDEWAELIAESIKREDEVRPGTLAAHEEALNGLREYIVERQTVIDAFLDRQ